MIKWLVGLNGSGKTVLLEEELDNAIASNKEIVTNIRPVSYQGFDIRKINKLKESEFFEEIFDYGDLEITNNKITIINNDFNYTDYFMNILTLLCREGNTLILDEPEFGLYGIEIDILAKVFQILIQFYTDGYIATHCQELFSVQPQNFYWCHNYKIKKLTEEELYEHIGEF